MNQAYSLKMDAFSQIVPPKYKEHPSKIAPQEVDRWIAHVHAFYDLECGTIACVP